MEFERLNLYYFPLVSSFSWRSIALCWVVAFTFGGLEGCVGFFEWALFLLPQDMIALYITSLWNLFWWDELRVILLTYSYLKLIFAHH